MARWLGHAVVLRLVLQRCWDFNLEVVIASLCLAWLFHSSSTLVVPLGLWDLSTWSNLRIHWYRFWVLSSSLVPKLFRRLHQHLLLCALRWVQHRRFVGLKCRVASLLWCWSCAEIGTLLLLFCSSVSSLPSQICTRVLPPDRSICVRCNIDQWVISWACLRQTWLWWGVTSFLLQGRTLCPSWSWSWIQHPKILQEMNACLSPRLWTDQSLLPLTKFFFWVDWISVALTLPSFSVRL